MRSLRMIAVGTLLHAKHLSRSPLEITIALLVPLVQATLAVYLFRAGTEPHRLGPGNEQHAQPGVLVGVMV